MEELTSTQASAEAVHKTKNAQQAIEHARELQMQRAVEEVAQRTKKDLIAGLREVFGDSDNKDPEQMKVLVRRIPILCVTMLQMHEDIKALKDNQTWAVRIIVGLFIAAIGVMIFKN